MMPHMSNPSQFTRYAVGVMTGTSIDGIDAAMALITGNGLNLKAQLIAHISRSLGKLAIPLRNAAEQKAMNAGEFAKLACEFGDFHAKVIGNLVESVGHAPDLICVHGQTIFHQPPYSWQLINPAPIAQRFKCPMVSDLRQADLAAGGQGAPITPIADWILFREPDKSRAIVNLGGFCNVTILPRARMKLATDSPAAKFEFTEELNGIRGFDVCACNQVLDAVSRSALGTPFDDRGRTANRGKYNEAASESLLEILKRQRAHRRSLGTGDEAMQWVQDNLGRLAPDDLAYNATYAIGTCIAKSLVEHGVEEAIVAGGGARHELLLEVIDARAEIHIRPSDELGVPIEARESMCFAILGALCADGVPITLPQVTGCKPPAPRAGIWCMPIAGPGSPALG